MVWKNQGIIYFCNCWHKLIWLSNVCLKYMKLCMSISCSCRLASLRNNCIFNMHHLIDNYNGNDEERCHWVMLMDSVSHEIIHIMFLNCRTYWIYSYYIRMENTAITCSVTCLLNKLYYIIKSFKNHPRNIYFLSLIHFIFQGTCSFPLPFPKRCQPIASYSRRDWCVLNSHK